MVPAASTQPTTPTPSIDRTQREQRTVKRLRTTTTATSMHMCAMFACVCAPFEHKHTRTRRTTTTTTMRCDAIVFRVRRCRCRCVRSSASLRSLSRTHVWNVFIQSVESARASSVAGIQKCTHIVKCTARMHVCTESRCEHTVRVWYQ